MRRAPMETLNRVRTVRDRVALWRREGRSIGLVSTMGNVHKGHISLVEKALEHCDHVVVSVFVNPLQFGPGEDLYSYPRTLVHDTELLAKAGVSLLFAPTSFEMFPIGVERTAVVDVPELSGVLEGQFRPGHFAGVATILTKLFNIVQPHYVAVGEKNFQQVEVVRRMVRDLCMPIEVLVVPTMRDHDGLALSSRNQGLSRVERNLASRLYVTLRQARQQILDGERRWSEVESAGLRELASHGFGADYFSIRRSSDLLPPRHGDRELVILTAARMGGTRLIDNLRVEIA